MNILWLPEGVHICFCSRGIWNYRSWYQAMLGVYYALCTTSNTSTRSIIANHILFPSSEDLVLEARGDTLVPPFYPFFQVGSSYHRPSISRSIPLHPGSTELFRRESRPSTPTGLCWPSEGATSPTLHFLAILTCQRRAVTEFFQSGGLDPVYWPLQRLYHELPKTKSLTFRWW